MEPRQDQFSRRISWFINLRLSFNHPQILTSKQDCKQGVADGCISSHSTFVITKWKIGYNPKQPYMPQTTNTTLLEHSRELRVENFLPMSLHVRIAKWLEKFSQCNTKNFTSIVFKSMVDVGRFGFGWAQRWMQRRNTSNLQLDSSVNTLGRIKTKYDHPDTIFERNKMFLLFIAINPHAV